MKILIISYFFPPLNSIASLRAYSLAKSFAAMGHDVSVLTASKPAAPHDLVLSDNRIQLIEIRSRFLDWIFKRLRINSGSSNTSIEMKSSYADRLYTALNAFRIRRGLLVLGRLPDFFDLLIGPSKRAVEGQSFDLVISSYAPRYCHAVGYHLKRANEQTCWVADYRDLWTRHHQFQGLWPFTIFERILEKRYLSKADCATTVTPQLAAELTRHLPTPRVLVVPNGYDQNDLDELPLANVFSGTRKRWVYTGTIYPGWQGFTTFLGALAGVKAEREDLAERLEVIFAGADAARLEELSKTLALDDIVSFVGLLPRTQALCMQRDADALLFFDPDEGAGIATGKLYEYLSSGTSVWRIGPSDPTFASQLVRDSRAGFDLGFCENSLRHHFDKFLDARLPARQADFDLIRNYERSRIAQEFLTSISPQLKARDQDQVTPEKPE